MFSYIPQGVQSLWVTIYRCFRKLLQSLNVTQSFSAPGVHTTTLWPKHFFNNRRLIKSLAIVPRIKKRPITIGYENTIASSKRYRLQVCTKNQTATQRSGFELERRSKGAERSFKAAPKGTALKRSGADFAPTWRSGWDSNPRAVACKLISSQPRYDHFDTAAYYASPHS